MALQCGNNEAGRIVMEGVVACAATLPHLLATTAEGKHAILNETCWPKYEVNPGAYLGLCRLGSCLGR